MFYEWNNYNLPRSHLLRSGHISVTGYDLRQHGELRIRLRNSRCIQLRKYLHSTSDVYSVYQLQSELHQFGRCYNFLVGRMSIILQFDGPGKRPSHRYGHLCLHASWGMGPKSWDRSTAISDQWHDYIYTVFGWDILRDSELSLQFLLYNWIYSGLTPEHIHRNHTNAGLWLHSSDNGHSS